MFCCFCLVVLFCSYRSRLCRTAWVSFPTDAELHSGLINTMSCSWEKMSAQRFSYRKRVVQKEDSNTVKAMHPCLCVCSWSSLTHLLDCSAEGLGCAQACIKMPFSIFTPTQPQVNAGVLGSSGSLWSWWLDSITLLRCWYFGIWTVYPSGYSALVFLPLGGDHKSWFCFSALFNQGMTLHFVSVLKMLKLLSHTVLVNVTRKQFTKKRCSTDNQFIITTR